MSSCIISHSCKTFQDPTELTAWRKHVEKAFAQRYWKIPRKQKNVFISHQSFKSSALEGIPFLCHFTGGWRSAPWFWNITAPTIPTEMISLWPVPSPFPPSWLSSHRERKAALRLWAQGVSTWHVWKLNKMCFFLLSPSDEIPHAAERLNLCATATGPAL